MTLSLSALTLFPLASTPLPSSSTWNLATSAVKNLLLGLHSGHLRFSRRMTDPWAGLAQAASTSAPTQSPRKVMSRPSSFFSSSATGASVNLAFLQLRCQRNFANVFTI